MRSLRIGPIRHSRLILAATFVLTACAGTNWEPLRLPSPAPLDSRTVLEFHARDSLIRLHGVRFTRDSLSGIPWLDHLSCDSCRVTYRLSDISGVRTGDPGAGAWVVAGPMLVITGFIAALTLAFGLAYHGD
jgi:hypothetical protein